MRKSLLFISCAIGGTVLLGSGLSAQENKTASLVPQSGWSVNRIEGNEHTADSYCALSRQYSQGMVLTLGRNAAEEYSLALDFQSAQLNTDRAVSLTLQPGPGQLRAYEMHPASQRAIVIRLGYDESFFKALQESKSLKAEIDGKNYEFSIPDIAKGQQDLNNCMRGLKGAPATKVAEGFSAEKMDNPPPMKTKEPAAEEKIVKAVPEELPEEIKMADEKLAQAEAIPAIPEPPEQEKLADVMPEPEMNPVPAPEVVSEPTPLEPPEKVAAMTDIPSDVVPPPPPLPEMQDDMQEELQAPQQAVSIAPAEPEVSTPPPPAIEITKVESRKIEKPAPKVEAKAEPPPMPAPEKIEMVKEEVEKTEEPKQMVSRMSDETKPYTPFRTAMQAEGNRPTVSRKEDTGPTIWSNTSQKKRRDELDRLKEENSRLNKALKTEMNKKPEPVAAPEPVVTAPPPEPVKQPDPMPVVAEKKAPETKNTAEMEKLRLENEQLRLAVRAMSTKQDQVAENNEPSANAETMKQLSNLKAENQRLSAALQGQQDKLASFDTGNPQAEEELMVLKEELKMLREKNKELVVQRREAHGKIDKVVVNAGNQAMSRIKDYEKKLEAAKADNMALSREIEELRRMREDKMLSSVAGDWDLEKATKRYNEAEREIKRLGMLLEQQRMAHRQEKSELEDMLFDPAVTDMEQRKRLTEMEMQLAEAERQLAASGRRMPQRPRMGNTPSGERVPVGVTPNPFVSQQRDNLEMRRMNNQIERQSRQIEAYKRERDGQAIASPKPPVSAQPLQPPPQAQPRPPMAQPVSTGPAFGKGNLQTLLNSAGVTLTGALAKQSSGEYRWNSGNLTGHAKVVPASQAGSLDQFAQNYIATVERTCGGDFASLPARPSDSRTKSFEIACISPSRSTSSSVVFAQKGSDFVAIAHEAAAADLDAAMDARDRVASSM